MSCEVVPESLEYFVPPHPSSSEAVVRGRDVGCIRVDRRVSGDPRVSGTWVSGLPRHNDPRPSRHRYLSDVSLDPLTLQPLFMKVQKRTESSGRPSVSYYVKNIQSEDPIKGSRVSSLHSLFLPRPPRWSYRLDYLHKKSTFSVCITLIFTTGHIFSYFFFFFL